MAGITRFIPTRVGNTRSDSENASAVTVHPHTRGEHNTWASRKARTSGSSPHAWGTRRNSGNNLLGRRFIPTRVGNTCGGLAS